MDNTIDLQTVPVRCATKDGAPYVYVETTNSGTRDGVAELLFQVDGETCSGITLKEVQPGVNCKIEKHDVSDDGQQIEAHINYDQAGEASTSLTYSLHYEDSNGTLRQAYGGEPSGDVNDVVGAVSGLAARGGNPPPDPPPKVEFP